MQNFRLGEFGQRAVKIIAIFIALFLWAYSFRALPDMKLASSCRIASEALGAPPMPQATICFSEANTTDSRGFDRSIWFLQKGTSCASRYTAASLVKCSFKENYLWRYAEAFGPPASSELGWVEYVYMEDDSKKFKLASYPYSPYFYSDFPKVEKAVIDSQYENRLIYPLAKPYVEPVSGQ